MTDDLDTARALREALDDEVAKHPLAAGSWPAIERRLIWLPSRRTWLARVAPALAAAAVAAVAVVVAIASHQSAGRFSSPTGTHGPLRHGRFQLTNDGVLHFPDGPIERLAAGYGAIWVGGAGVTYRVDPATDRIVATIPTAGAGRYSDIATGAGAVWVSGTGPAGTGLGLYRIDPQLNRVTAVIPLPGAGHPGSITCTGGDVWVTSQAHFGSILRVDPMLNEVVGQPVPVNAPVPGPMIPHRGVIWVNANSLAGPLTTIDPVTGGLARRVGKAWGKVTNVAAIQDGSLWTFGFDGIHRINLATGRITATIPLFRADQLVFVQGIAVAMVLATPGIGPADDGKPAFQGSLVCIDLVTSKIACPAIQLASLPAFFAAGPDGLWVTNLKTRTLTHFALKDLGN